MGTWAARGRPALCLRSPTSPLRQRAGSAASPWNAAWKSRTRPSPAQRAHHLVIGERLLRLAMKDDLAAIDYVEPIGDRRRTHEIGFGDQQRDAKGLDGHDRLTETFHDGGREPFESLVEDQEIRSERHGPGDRHHFPLAATQILSLSVDKLAYLRKYGERPRFGIAMAWGAALRFLRQPSADHQVLGDCQLWKNTGVLRRIANPQLGAPMRRQ